MFIEPELYYTIKLVMPVSCVDLFITDEKNRVLLMLRKNHPCQNQWFTPGGRIYKGELRIDAANRKFTEETGIDSTHILNIIERSTYDMMFESVKNLPSLHFITTVYKIKISSKHKIVLDDQHSAYKWLTAEEWLSPLNCKLHYLIIDNLNKLV